MPSILNSDDGVVSGTSGLKSTGGNDGITAFQQNGTERMRIDSSGNVGIGDTNPSTTRLTLFSGGAGTVGQLKLGYDGTAYWQIGRNDPAGTGSGNFQFKPNGGTTVFDITTGGTVVLSGGSLSATGVGITFPATQSASTDANTLDDYEEGTWTPVPTFIATTGITYEYSPVGKYTKIGNLIKVECAFRFSNKGSSSGAFKITGLPFTVGNTGSYRHPVPSVCFFYGATTKIFSGLGVSTEIQLRRQDVANADTDADFADFQNNTALMITLVYEVA